MIPGRQRQQQSRRFPFNKRAIEALPPHDPDSGATDCEWSDTGCVGLKLRISKAGRKFYMMRYTFRGRKRCLSIAEHTDRFGVAEARLAVAEHKAALAKGIDPSEAREKERTDLTFEEFCTLHYIPSAMARKKSWADDKQKIETHLNPAIGTKPLKSITARDVATIHTKQKARTSAATSNRILSTLKRALNVAVRLGFLDRNPAASEEKFPESPPRERYLSKEEMGRFLSALEQDDDKLSVAAIRLLAYTGCRRSEIVALLWANVRRDTDSWKIHIPLGKNGRSRTVHLNTKAKEVLEELAARKGDDARTRDSEYVFPSRQGTKKSHLFDLRNPFRKACALAKIKGICLHGLRHSFASQAVMAGVSLYDVQKMLGHQNIAMTERYAHVADEHLTQASEATVAGMNKTGTVDENETLDEKAG